MNRTEKKKWGIIYNPKAGTRKVQKRWQEIKNYMDSLGVAYDYVQSEGFGSVERLAGILADNGYRTIVIVGGDGALNDAINGIMNSQAEQKEDIALGIIPNGIGNDFADYWELSGEYKEAVDCLVHGRRRRIDVGTCSYYDGQKHVTRYFLNAVNIGLGARIVKITDQCKRFWGVKYLSYFMAFLSLIFERKLYRMHLKINDEHIRAQRGALQRLAGRVRHLPPGAAPTVGRPVDAHPGAHPEPQTGEALPHPSGQGAPRPQRRGRPGRPHLARTAFPAEHRDTP